jgi:hypothetical protein
MALNMVSRRSMIALASLIAFLPAATAPAMDGPAITMKKWAGRIEYSTKGPSPFELKGMALQLGSFMARGEVTFRPGETPETLVGEGIVVFMDDEGDFLVGETTWIVDGEDNLEMHFAWCDSVTFSDGSEVSSTGRFADQLPNDLTVNGIIAILIGLLAPPR